MKKLFWGLFLTVSVLFGCWGALVQTDADDFVEQYNISVRGEVQTIPYQVLEKICADSPNPGFFPKITKLLQSKSEDYPFTPEELWSLMVSSLLPEEQKEFVSGYAGKTVYLSYDNGSILISSSPN